MITLYFRLIHSPLWFSESAPFNNSFQTLQFYLTALVKLIHLIFKHVQYKSTHVFISGIFYFWINLWIFQALWFCNYHISMLIYVFILPDGFRSRYKTLKKNSCDLNKISMLVLIMKFCFLSVFFYMLSLYSVVYWLIDTNQQINY